MRSIWSGAMSFSLIYIPVRLYTASDDQKLDLDMLRKGDLWRGVLGPGMDMPASVDVLQASWSHLVEKLKSS